MNPWCPAGNPYRHPVTIGLMATAMATDGVRKRKKVKWLSGMPLEGGLLAGISPRRLQSFTRVNR